MNLHKLIEKHFAHVALRALDPKDGMSVDEMVSYEAMALRRDLTHFLALKLTDNSTGEDALRQTIECL